jgi:hypothetical protein
MENEKGKPLPTRSQPNDDVNNVQGTVDLIVDEYGNYYTIYKTTHRDGKLIKVLLVHILYFHAFASVFLNEEIKTKYQYSHLGEYLLDRINAHISSTKKNGRKIFTIQELIDNGTDIEFWDITSYKTKINK